MVNLINYKFKYVNIFRTRIAFSLFILSFSTGLFSLTIFQTLSFLIIPVIYFFILLLFGMPIGSIISIKYFNDNRHDFQKSLYITEFSMISSLILFIIFIKIENILFFGIDLSSNYILILKFIIRLFFGILFFLSFFISYGMTEFLGYQIGLTYLNQNSKLIYSLYLFGTASSYLFFRLLLDHVGISSLIFFSLIGIISANLLIKSKNNYLNYAKILILIIMLFNSKLENIYLDILESKESGFSTKYFSNLDSNNIFQGWSKYCHLSISEDNNLIYGFYNGLLAWIYPKDLKKFQTGGDCIKCKYLDICGGRCLYWNKADLWPKTGNLLICKTIKFLIDSLKEKLPEIKNLISDGLIKEKYFSYEKYFGPEIIP
jgi:radical SAM protein with 4Fe4S-binding SPASM domain